MNRTRKPNAIVALAVTSVAGLAVVFALIAIESSFRPPVAGTDLAGVLNQTQEKAIDLMLNLVSLFVTFAISILGGSAFFVASSLKKELPLRKWSRVLLATSGVLGVMSIFFGHLVYSALVTMLANDFLDLHASFLVWPMRLQYVCLLLELSAFVAVVVYAVPSASPD